MTKLSMNQDSPKSKLFREWSQDVVEIKELFQARKYRRCVARCEEFYAVAAHPIHKTFLGFYQALCYESLGIAAHPYSENKLPLLNLAKDSFSLALRDLNELGDEDRLIDTQNVLDSNQKNVKEEQLRKPAFGSPACVTLDVVKRYQFPSPSTDSTTSPGESSFDVVDDNHYDGSDKEGQRMYSSPASSVYSTEEADYPVVATPGPNSPDQNISDEVSSEASRKSKRYLTTPLFTHTPKSWNKSSANHKIRLSQSLSTNHCLADELVPSPLFRRFSQTDSRNTSDLETPSKSPKTLHHCPYPAKRFSQEVTEPQCKQERSNSLILNAIADSRPLPPLPFNHKPHFEQRGSRHVLIPSNAFTLAPRESETTPQATAIQTMVAKFEDKIRKSSVAWVPAMPFTPVTPRFRIIEQAFAIRDELDTDGMAVRYNEPGRNTNLAGVDDAGVKIEDDGKVDGGIRDVTIADSPVSKALAMIKAEATPTLTPLLRMASIGRSNSSIQHRSHSRSHRPPPIRISDEKQSINDQHTDSTVSPQSTPQSGPFDAQLPPLPKPSPSPTTNPLTVNPNSTTTSSLNPNKAPTQTPPSASTPPSTLNIQTESFRKSLQYHLKSITTQITSVTQAQDDHRAQRISRSMSFWSFDVKASVNDDVKVKRRGLRGSDPTTVRRGRDRNVEKHKITEITV